MKVFWIMKNTINNIHSNCRYLALIFPFTWGFYVKIKKRKICHVGFYVLLLLLICYFIAFWTKIIVGIISTFFVFLCFVGFFVSYYKISVYKYSKAVLKEGDRSYLGEWNNIGSSLIITIRICLSLNTF